MRGAALVFFVMSLTWCSISLSQGPSIELGVDRPNAEGITVTHTIEEIPPGAIYLGCDLSFEASDGFPGDCWYGEQMGNAFRTIFRPADGYFHLRQKDGWSIVYQNIDISSCSPIHPVWITGNVLIESNRAPDLDVQEGIIFDGLTGLSLVTLWTHWNHEGDMEYDEIRVRVEGLGQTSLIRLAIGADFSPGGLFEFTIYDTDHLTVACMPIGWVEPGEYKIYLPYIGR